MNGFPRRFTTFAAMKNKLHIVGLRYYTLCGQMDEIFAPQAARNGTWMGQKLFLQRDHQCIADAHAVMAWTLTEPVGHVCEKDLPLIAGVLEQGYTDIVVVHIVGLDAVRKALVVEPVDELPELPCPEPELPSWTWEGPVLPQPMVWAQADHFGRMMNLMLQGEIPWNEEVVKGYMQYTATDLSGDTYGERSRLADRLLRNTDPCLSETGHRLLAMMDHMGSKERLSAWYNQMATTLMNSPEAQSLVSRYFEVDVHQTLAALRSFPLEIGREWLAGNYELFARRLYYGHLRRTDILKLFSVIILYASACRRVQPLPVQPAIGLNLGGACQMNVSSLDNHGTIMSIEQARILPNPLNHNSL